MITKLIYPLLLLILLVFLFLGLGDKILYAKSGIERIVPYLLIFAGIPFCIYKNFLFIFDKKRASNFTALSILIIGPGFGIWSGFLSEQDLKKYEKVTYGEVIKREWISLKNRGGFTITAQFEYNSKKFKTFSKDDIDNRFRLKDKIRIRFSTRNPENNEIIDLN